MSSPKFAKTHKLVAFLEKPTESEEFEQIIDFLNVNPIKYALTVNPTIYTSCIKQFWATAKVNTFNGEEHIQALVDKKKVIITETSVRSDLQLEDDEGIECLQNATNFEQLTLMGAKTTAWNEFSSTMASVIICLATNQKFNFSKYICDNMVKNLEGGVKFLMFSRFVQVLLDKQVEGMFKHKNIYVIPSRTKKVFANMKRKGKDFSGGVTPLFPTMLVQPQQKRKQKTKKPMRKDTELPQTSVPTKVVADEAVYEEMYDSVETVATTATGLDAEQDKGIISKTKFTTTLNETSSIGTSLGSGPRHQKTMGDAAAQTRSERVSKFSNDPPLLRVNTLGSWEDRLKLSEPMELCTQLQPRERNDQDMFDTGVLDDEEVVAEKKVSTIDPDTTAGVEVSIIATTLIIFMDDITLAKALADLKSAKPMVKEPSVPKAKGIVMQEPEETAIRTTTTVPSQGSKDKGKAKMIEPEKPLKKKYQSMIDEEVARNLKAQLQAELEEEERLAR
nr:hypothetical protein [Tanacetum cinerariifolium]